MIEESLAISREMRDQMGVDRTLNFQGRLALKRSDTAFAREHFEKARAVFDEIGDPTALVDHFVCL